MKTVQKNERNQTKKDTNYKVLFIRNIYNRQIYRHRKSTLTARGWGQRGNWEWLLTGTMFLLGGDGKVLQLDSDDNGIYEHTKKNHWTVHF